MDQLELSEKPHCDNLSELPLEGEVWRPFPECSGYQVSSHGRVRRQFNGRGTWAGRILKQSKHFGYCGINFNINRVSSTHRINVAVCTAFHGPRPSERHHAAHGDGVRHNNHYKNLRWATPEENQYDRVAHGTSHRGEQIHKSKLKDTYIPIIRKLMDMHVPHRVIADAFSVSPSTITLISKGAVWRHV